MSSTLNEMIMESADTFSGLPALKIREGEIFKPISYRDLGEIIQKLGTGLIDLGVKNDDRIGLISDNRFEWIMCDLAVLGTGACDVPRGSDTTPQEIEYILKHADIETAFVEDKKQLEKIYAIGENLPTLKNLILISSQKKIDPQDYSLMNIYTMDGLIKRGKELLAGGDRRFVNVSKAVKPDDVATIIYTSGTTGEPKGVMLTHGNIMHNVRNGPKSVPITKGDRFLSILPAWHSFERTCEYILLYVGASNAYSKPTAQVLLKDFETEKPNYIVSVPRIWEALYNAIHYKISKDSAIKRGIFLFFVKMGIRYHKSRMRLKGLLPYYRPKKMFERTGEVVVSAIRAFLLRPVIVVGDRLVYNKIREKTGGCLLAGISGGGALQSHVDDFFAGVRLRVLEGYGLTETSPIVAVRTFERPVPYTVGPLLEEVQVKIVDENGKQLPSGHKGIIMVKGPLVMKGYYKNPEATEKVITADGWMNTGDLGRMTYEGELQITGRAKDTIVLLGGENIEPLPIEQKLTESIFINQVMVVGQDKKTLGALIVPDFEKLEEYARETGVEYGSRDGLLEHPTVKNLYRTEVKSLISPKNGFRTVEYIPTFRLLSKEFEIGRELTQTLKIRRNIISDAYGEHIASMYR